MKARFTLGEGDRRLLGVDGVENAFVSDLRLRRKAEFAAEIGNGGGAHLVCRVARRSRG